MASFFESSGVPANVPVFSAADVNRTGATPITTKPDGTASLEVPSLSSAIRAGTAISITGKSVESAINSIKDSAGSIAIDPSKLQQSGSNLSSIIPNPLEQFASYTVLWTMACLEPTQFNNPMSYRNSSSDLKNVVFSSAGRYDSQRSQTIYGAPEYFINNFNMRSAIAPTQKTGNTNAFKFEFDIIEPHSMGLLLQSMQVAAISAGYPNYLSNAPFVLKMDIQGYNEVGQSIKSIKPKFFVLKLTKVTFKVNEAGSVYHVEAVPYNHQGMSDVNSSIYKDVKIIGGPIGSVEEILRTGENSLMSVLNGIERTAQLENKVEVPNVYDIQFPINSWDFTPISEKPSDAGAILDMLKEPARKLGAATVAELASGPVNDIGKSNLGFDQGSGGNIPFRKPSDVYDEKTGTVQRDQLTIDVKNRAFQFAQGQSIIKVITQVIICSDYALRALDEKNVVDGMVKWFKVDVQVELKEFDNKTGEYAKKFTYRVVPHMVHHSVFTNPNATPTGYPQIERRICKRYDYIYTGQNADILKFDIEINNLFYTGVNSSPENESGLSSDPNTQSGTTNPPEKTTATGEGSSPGAQTASQGRARPMKDPNMLYNSRFRAGSGTTTVAQQVAQAFHNSFLQQSTDMVKVNMEIMGDTYWMVDSGMNNYFSTAPAPTSLVTDDGSMNYEGNDVFIYLTFRTPVDINEKTGLYDFSMGGKESPFGGIYRVVKCESIFADGTFKQRLDLVRMPAQEKDFIENGKPLEGIKPEKTQLFATEIGKEEQEKTSPSEDNYNDLEFDP